MEITMGIAALALSAGWAFWGGVVASFITDGPKRDRYTAAALWIVLTVMCIAFSFIAGRVWP